MISFLPELEERVVMSKEKGDNFIRYVPAYHFSFVTFQALSQLYFYSQQFGKNCHTKSEVLILKDYFKAEAVL